MSLTKNEETIYCLKKILRKLFNRKIFGAKHLPRVRLQKSFDPHDGRLVKRAIKLGIKRGLIITHQKATKDIALNPRAIDEIESLISELE